MPPRVQWRSLLAVTRVRAWAHPRWAAQAEPWLERPQRQQALARADQQLAGAALARVQQAPAPAARAAQRQVRARLECRQRVPVQLVAAQVPQPEHLQLAAARAARPVQRAALRVEARLE